MRWLFVIFSFLIISLYGEESFSRELKVAMGVNYPPMHFKDDQGNLVGFEVDLVKLFAEKNGLEISFVNPKDLNKTSFEMVHSGEVDLAVNSLTITEERKKYAIFSEPYFISGTGVILSSKNTDLNFSNCTVLYLENLISNSVLNQINKNQTRALNNLDQIIDLLKNEKYHSFSPFVFIYDWISLQEILKKNNELSLYGFTLEKEPYGAVFKDRNDCILWNDLLNQIRLNGQYNVLYKKWFADLKISEIKSVANIMMDVKSNKPPIRYSGAEILSSENISNFLPVLFDESFMNFKGDRNIIYEHLKSKFSKAYLPQIKEIFLKGGVKNSYRFYDFILDTDSVEILPLIYKFLYFREPFSSKAIDILLTAMSIKHSELKNEIVNVFDDYIDNKSIHFELFNPCGGNNEWNLEMSIYLDAKKSRIRKFIIDDKTSFKLLKSEDGNQTKVKLDDIVGFLKEMPLRGEAKLRINKIDYGIVHEFEFPNCFEYVDVDNDGNTLFFKYKDFLFLYNVQAKVVSQIKRANPINDRSTIELALSKLSGIKRSHIYSTQDGQVYLFQADAIDFDRCNLYHKETESGTFKKVVSFLTHGACPSSLYIVDNKIFFTGINRQDYYEKYNVVDIKTGCKIDMGYGGAIVPISPHELYYCSDNGYESHAPVYYIVDTKTLKRIPVKPIDCPWESENIRPHPFLRHFISIFRPSC